MKKIEAIIRKTKFEEVRDELHKVGIDFFTFWEARGVGQAAEERIYRGIKYDTSSIERIFITFFCNDEFAEPAIKVIMETAKTGDKGDGRIFIMDIEDAYRIRTGEKGGKAFGTLES
jgi:nitrogen regulatory protein P-II 1